MALFHEAQSAKLGRHLVAAQDISAGQAVLQQQPYAAVLYDDQVPLRCDWCFRPAAAGCTLLRCTRSKFAHYCSKEHQKAAWKAYYRQECAVLVACAPHAPPATVRMAARALWRRDSEHQQNAPAVGQQPQQQQQVSAAADSLRQQLAGGSFTDVEQLLSHWEDLDDARKLQYAQMAVLTREFMQGASQPQQEQQQQQQQQQQQDAHAQQQSASSDTSPATTASVDVRQIAQLLARFACNNHTICDEELRPIGVGIYPLGALLNHDCRPNCVQVFDGRNIVFRSLRSIPAGQQLCISYIELAATRQERRRQLLQSYFFDIDVNEQPPATALEANQPPAVADPNQPPTVADAQSSTDAQQLAAGADRSLHELRQSGLCRLQLLVSLPDPGLQLPAPVQQQQQLPLWAAGGAGALHTAQQYSVASSGDTSRGASHSQRTSSRSSSSRVPFPEDPPDAKLSQVLLLVQSPGATGDSSNSSSSWQRVQLPGGMCLLPQLQAAAGSLNGTAAASAELLSGLFQDLEGLGGAGEAAEAKSMQHQASKQQQQLEAVQWGDWAAVLQQRQLLCTAEAQAASAVNGHAQQLQQLQQEPSKTLAAAGAGLLLHVWQLQQQAERLTREGDAGTAVQLCQAALSAADGKGPYASVCEAPAAQPLVPEEACSTAGADAETPGAAADANAQLAALVADGSSGSIDCRCVRMALGPAHVLRIRALAALLCAAVDSSQWQVAQQAARQLTPLYELVYPQVWPNLGLHYAMLAKLELLLEQPAAAARLAEAAASILGVTHGSSAAVLQEVYRTRYEAAQELAAADSMGD